MYFVHIIAMLYFLRVIKNFLLKNFYSHGFIRFFSEMSDSIDMYFRELQVSTVCLTLN